MAAPRELPPRRACAGRLRSGALPAGRHAFEFRHPSWFDRRGDGRAERARRGARARGPSARGFQSDQATAGWRYIRYHEGARGQPRQLLRRRARGLGAPTSPLAQTELFVYFNNDWEGFAPRNARSLRERLAQLAAKMLDLITRGSADWAGVLAWPDVQLDAEHAVDLVEEREPRRPAGAGQRCAFERRLRAPSDRQGHSTASLRDRSR